MGWQVNIKYFDNYVIKTPKSEMDMRKEIERYLVSVNKIDELDKRIKDMQEGWKRGMEIVSSKKIPSHMLGDIEILEDGKIKQKRATVLGDKLNYLIEDGNLVEVYNTIDYFLKFILSLWRLGLHECTGKFLNEFGLVDDKIILLDFGELTENKETVRKQILKRYWEKSINKSLSKEIAFYFCDMARAVLTSENLDRYWRKDCKH